MGSKRKLVLGSEDDDDCEESQQDLERSIKELYQEDANDNDPTMSEVRKKELISKLGEARQEEADLERMARRIAWRREVRRTLANNAEFKEIMEEVPLEEVEVEEKARLSRTSMKWREAFKKERASFLFPQALSTMLSTLSDPPTDPEVLVNRLVCKAAKKSVDTLLTSELFSPRMWTCDVFFFTPFYIYDTMGISKFDNLERAKAFRRKFDHAANPFFIPNIDISPPGGPSYPKKYLKEMEEILRRWGKELWSAHLDFELNSNSAGYDMLVTWLKLMPNVRLLRLYFGKDEKITRVMKHIAKNPLPDMACLAHLHIILSGPSSVIAHAMLSKFNSGLERVTLEFNREFERLPICDTLSNCAPPATVEGSFPALGNLRAYYVNVGSVADVGNIIKNLSNLALPLKKLELELRNMGITANGKGYGRLFVLDNRALASKGLFLEMPQLEELSLVIYFRMELRTLDFLLPCRALKVLRVRNLRIVTGRKPRRNQQPQPPVDNGIFQFPTDPADKDRVYRSPIWKLLPELKLIVFITVMITKCGKFNNARFQQSMTIGEPVTYQYTREEYLQQGTGE